MQTHQNASFYHNDSVPNQSKSPLTKIEHDSKSGFKSPLASAQKKKLPQHKVNNENEPDQNPFSGPTYNPSSLFQGTLSPLTKTPIKLKEEYMGDYFEGNKDYVFGRAFGSPYTNFCKDLTLSPAPASYNFLSPATHQMKSQYNNFGFPVANSTYSPIFDHTNSPSFTRKNITRLDFSNPSKLITLKSRKDEISIETDDVDLLELHKNSDMARFGMSPGRDENFLQPTQLKFPTTKSVYVNSMPVSMNANDVFTQKQEEFTTRKENYFNRLESIPEEGSFSFNPAMTEKFADKSPRTPSPSSHNLGKMKLDSLNSFSAQAKDPENIKKANEDRRQDYQSYESTTEKGKKKHGEVAEGLCSSKQKKKVCCNCKKSRCLKLYCDCFGRGQPCSKECNCVNCLNTEAHFKERQEAMNSVLERNPSAFKPKVDRTDSPEKVELSETKDQGRVRHMKGCNCKKSGCQKKYCECFQAGVKCTELCKCENCKNMDSCCRFKRVQNFGLLNLVNQDNLNMGLIFPEATTLKRAHTFCKEEESPYGDENAYWQSQTQGRVRLTNPYHDFNSLTELPVSKKRKMETGFSEFTPKRMLVFNKEEFKEEDEKGSEDFSINFSKGKNLLNFVTPYAQTEKKRIEKLENISEYTPSPGKPFASGRRTKRNVKPFSQFNPEEYELNNK